jgi:CRP-like cAMP-binding protein
MSQCYISLLYVVHFKGGLNSGDAQGIVEELSFTTVRQRLIGLILRLEKTSVTHSSEGVQVELSKSQQDLAAELGTVRELISRNLGRLQAEGYLDVKGSSSSSKISWG